MWPAWGRACGASGASGARGARRLLQGLGAEQGVRIGRASGQSAGRPWGAAAVVARALTTDTAAPRLCIVGAGPAGFYTAQQFRKAVPTAHIALVERLPAPYGLVRYGVAPDHPEVKNVIAQFAKLAESENVSYFGHVNVGTDVTLAELRSLYDAVVLTYGAQEDKRLGIPGEDADGVLSAREFVGWYNGLPELASLSPPLQRSETAVVLGQGNVALDVARILLAPLDELAKTDICSHAVQALERSTIRNVLVVGRRGPLQVAFTVKELREMTRLSGVETHLDPSHFDFSEEERTFVKNTRPRKRLTELMEATSRKTRTGPAAPRHFEVVFCRQPVEILTDAEGQVTGVVVEKTRLEGPPDQCRAVGTGETEVLEAGLVLRSVGYKGNSLDEVLPFDHQRGTIDNDGGRVRNTANLYCSGWIKRGPSGVILNTMQDAFATASVMIDDFQSGRWAGGDAAARSGTPGLARLLDERGVDVVTFPDWQRIEAAERTSGEARGKSAEKFVAVADMLAARKAASRS